MKASPSRMFLLAALLLPALAPAAPVVFDGVGGGLTVNVTSIKESRFRGMVRQKYDFSCGSAAVATLLSYHYGTQVSEQVVFESMYAKGDKEKIRKQGFSLLDMKNFLSERGFDANGFKAGLDDLEKAAVPAIVLVQDSGYNHFVVIKGVKGNQVLIGDPAMGNRMVTRQQFSRIWRNNILFLVRNRQELAQFNLERDWRVREHAPLGAALSPENLMAVTLLMPSRNDF